MGIVFFLIIVLIIWVIVLSKFTVDVLQILQANDFQKIVILKTTATKTFYTAIKNGENYLIANIDGIKVPDAKDIEDTVKEMEEIHYHYGILITKSTCPQLINEYAKRIEIEVIYFMDLVNNRNKNIIIDNNVIETKIDNTGVGENSYINTKNSEINPIQDTKGNSIVSNLFKKPDKL